MARQTRFDGPDTWHHVVNRGVARRTMFENREDIAVFEEQLGAANERGDLEFHAFAVLTTHYHLLVRSPTGRLASGMQRIQTEYSRWFNRSRRRDGPLVRGRYASKQVDTLRYRQAVVRYIDRNPVSAGLVERAEDYPYGSARIYAGLRQAPEWLETGWVRDEVMLASGTSRYDPASYSKAFGHLSDELSEVVEERLRHRASEDPLDDLVKSAPAHVANWMRRKARLADASRPGIPIVPLDFIRQLVEHDVESHSPIAWQRRFGEQAFLLAGLGRQVSGARLVDIADVLSCSIDSARRCDQQHRELMLSDADYCARAGALAHRAMSEWLAPSTAS